MSDKEYGKIIGKNLKRLAWERKKSQADIARDLGISKATISSWMNGTRVPRMDKIDLLCKYFMVKRSEIIEEHDDVPTSGQDESYYLDDEAREMLRFLNENPEYKVLLSSSRKLKPEDLDIIKAMIERMS